MQKAIFTTTQSDLTKYNGTEVEVGAELTDAERDLEVGRMFHVTFNDGATGDAFEDELSFLNGGKKAYPMEDQLISISAVTPLHLSKDPWDMDEQELDNIIDEASKYVHWIDVDYCHQAVPALIGRDIEIATFDGTFEDLKALKTA